MKKNLSSKFNTRQYMRSRDFEIYFYSEHAPSMVPSHAHNYYEFYFFLSGNISMQIEDSSYELKPGDMVIIPPHVHHYAKIHDTSVPYQRFVFWISETYCNELLAISPDYVYLLQHVQVTHKYLHHFDIFQFNTIQSMIFQLIDELQFDRYGKDIKTSLCVKNLIFYLNRTFYEQEHPATPKEEQSLYQNLLSFIEHHLEEEITLDRLAQEFFVSKYYIAHLFKKNFGLSVHQYILKKRLANCRDAIISQTEISEAFLLCGFKDYSNFYRAFKKEYGMSPREYKEIYTQPHPMDNKE